MSENSLERLSKFLCLVLRHHPEAAGVTLEYLGGWADVEQLIAGVRGRGWRIDRDILDEIVRTDDKGRYAYSPDGSKIHACQGHSVPVDMGYQPVCPPEILYHGTTSRFLDKIFREGLRPMDRLYVHLSRDIPTAQTVGDRRKGETVILKVRAGALSQTGHLFYQADNGVWLTGRVPPQYLSLEADGE